MEKKTHKIKGKETGIREGARGRSHYFNKAVEEGRLDTGLLSRALKAGRQQTPHPSLCARAFQAKGTAETQALKWEPSFCSSGNYQAASEAGEDAEVHGVGWRGDRNSHSTRALQLSANFCSFYFE